jgi:hypothetical protein
VIFKRISRRRWKARMMLGLWIPEMIVKAYGFEVPDGYVGEAHPELDFFRIVKHGTMTT